jgi:hypothetical protein
MAIRPTKLWAVALCLLSLGIAISAYQTLFCAWMLAHPLYASAEWKARLEIRFATTVGLSAVFLTVVAYRVYLKVVAYLRRKRRADES